MSTVDPDAEPRVRDIRLIRLRYDGACAGCRQPVAAGAAAFHYPALKQVRCLTCGGPDGRGLAPPPLSAGVAGASSRREYERRRAARETRVRGRAGGFLGRILLALNPDPQSTRAWAQGASGEAAVAQALRGLPGIHPLHDRRVRGTRGNIDHLVVSRAGVFVIDAKRYSGKIDVRAKGWLGGEPRLWVGRRDCSKLAEAMRWQVEAVKGALASAGETAPVTPVLCFVDGQWPLLAPPSSFGGVRLEGVRSIVSLVNGPELLSQEAVGRITQLLAVAFPPK